MLPKFLKLIDAVIHPEDKSEESKYIRKILSEYRNKKPLYDEFRSAVHKLLDALLKENNYKYQIVSRTKTPERLREKLLRKNGQGTRYKSLDDIEDLAGIRVLFYSDSDKEHLIRELKEEIDGTVRIQDKKQKSGYEATHVVMTLGPKRLALSEYRQFSGLKAEIQVTSILRHTWAEIEHDFIYKDISGLKKRDPEKFAVMEERLGEILEKHIKQASSEVEKLIKWADQ